MGHKIFDLIMYTSAGGIDTTTPLNEVRTPLIHSLAGALPGDGKLLVVTHYVPLLTSPVREPRRLLKYLVQSRLRQDSANLWVYTPFLPLNLSLARKVPGFLSLCRFYLGLQVRNILHFLKFSSQTARVVWNSHPIHQHYQDLIGEKVTVYDCYDDYSLIAGREPNLDTMTMERSYVPKVNIVLTAARRQYENLKPLNINTHYFPNAVDFVFFNKATRESTPVAKPLTKIPRPIVGLMGGIRNWYNFEMLLEVISAKREWSFVFIGEVQSTPYVLGYVRTLQTFPNFYFLGWQDFEELPQFLKGFDVAIMPYCINDLGNSVHPDKVYQYMAAGVPTVATPIREITRFDDVLDLVDGTGDFCDAIERNLGQKYSARIRKGISLAQRESWDVRAEMAVDLIRRELDEKIN